MPAASSDARCRGRGAGCCPAARGLLWGPFGADPSFLAHGLPALCQLCAAVTGPSPGQRLWGAVAVPNGELLQLAGTQGHRACFHGLGKSSLPPKTLVK